jgi:predicted amino acid-binding ACT domain protein
MAKGGKEKDDSDIVPADDIESLIRTVRGQKVILDTDLARLYGVETRAFNRAVKRNADRFPPDFMFQLARDEFDNLKYQFGTSSSGHGGRRKLPWVFTENGAVMSANVLNSPQAVRMSVFVVRAFVKMREMLAGTRELAKQLKALEAKLTARLDVHESAIVEVLQRIMDVLNPPPPPPAPLKRQIGFHARSTEPKSQSAKGHTHSRHEIIPACADVPAVARGRGTRRR